MVSSEKRILTKKDIFRNLSLRKGLDEKDIEIVYEAFLKGIKDKIEAEDMISVDLAGLGSMYINVRESQRLLKIRGYKNFKWEDIPQRFYSLLKKRVEIAKAFTIDVMERSKNYSPKTTPYDYYKAYYFYGKTNGHLVANMKEDIQKHEKFQEKIFYEEDSRFN